jgi:hypothetical protein
MTSRKAGALVTTRARGGRSEAQHFVEDLFQLVHRAAAVEFSRGTSVPNATVIPADCYLGGILLRSKGAAYASDEDLPAIGQRVPPRFAATSCALKSEVWI